MVSVDSKELSVFIGILEILELFLPFHRGIGMSQHLSLTKSPCTFAFDGSKMPFDRGDVLDLVLLVQDQILRGVGERLESLEVGVPIGHQVVMKNYHHILNVSSIGDLEIVVGQLCLRPGFPVLER